MDGAWALFEAWLRLQVGDVDTALVIGSGRPSPGNHREAFALQTDPYFMAPLGLDPTSLAGLQARALLDRELATERDFAEVVVRSRQAGASNPKAMVTEQASVEELMAQPYVASPCELTTWPPRPTVPLLCCWWLATARESSANGPRGSVGLTTGSSPITPASGT